MMAFDDRRKPNVTRKVMWVSLALNLFLIGAVAGSFVAGGNGLHGLYPRGPSSDVEEDNPPPPLRMLDDIRAKLSPEGKKIFDTEFAPMAEELSMRRKDVEAFDELRQVLLRDDATDAEIRGAFAKMKAEIGDNFGRILTHMGNVAVKLSSADRAELALHRPGPPPGSPPGP